MGGHGRTLTCADEEDIVVSISSCDTVCSDLGEGVPGAHLLEERAPTDGQDRIVHEGVVPGKLDDIIRRRHDKEVDKKAGWAALHRRPPRTWSVYEGADIGQSPALAI